MTIENPTTARSFDYFREPKSPGLGGLGSIGTALLMIAAIIGILIGILVNLVAGILWGVAAGLTLMTMATRDQHGVSILEKTGTRTAHRRAIRKGTAFYRSGPLTKLGTYKLPGILADTDLSEWDDQTGNRFALVYTPRPEHYAVTIECFPDSASLIDDATAAGMVDEWGDWLSFLAYEPDLLQVMVTIGTAPDDGAGIHAEITGTAAPDPADLAARVMAQILTAYPAESAHVRSWVTLTFDGRHQNKARTPEEMGAALAHRLPEIIRKLTATGAGQAHLLDGQALCEVVRVAYDPACAPYMTPDRPTVMMWSGVGPVRAINRWDHYQHDSAVSVSWSMSNVLGRVNADGLAPLLRPHPVITRKRVSLIYTPHPPERSAAVAGKDLKSAEYRVTSVKKPSAAARKDLQAAEATAEEEAHGNPLVDFAVIVTATVRDAADLPEVDAVIDSAGPAARLLLRRENGGHAAAFAQSLPGIGLVTSAHSMIPRTLRESL